MNARTPAPCQRGYLTCFCASREFRLEPVVPGGSAAVPVCCGCGQRLNTPLSLLTENGQ